MNQRKPQKRFNPNLTRCMWHGCRSNATQGVDLQLCLEHRTHVADTYSASMTESGWFKRCAWSGCEKTVMYKSAVRFCLSHWATITYHGLRTRAVSDLVESMGDVDEFGPVKPKPEPKPLAEGHVYFLLSDSVVKIGWTSDLDERMRAYSPGARILAVMPGTKADESRLHKKFGHLKTNRREWFAYSPQVMEEVERVVREHGDPPRELNEPVSTARIVGPRLTSYTQRRARSRH